MTTPLERAQQIQIDYREEIISGNSPDIVVMVENAIKDFIKFQEKPPECPEHPKSAGKRKPRSNCTGCWRVYLFNHRGD